MKNLKKISLLLSIILLTINHSFGQNGKLIDKSFMHDNSLRTYSIYLPPAYDGETEWPLIINFHGYTSDVSDQIARTKMNVRADTAHFLVAYPQGLEIKRSPDILPSFVSPSGTGWSVPGFSSEYNDIEFIDMVIDDILMDYTLDISRIHTTGLSLGGYMAFYVASQLPDRIASVAGVAGHLTRIVQNNFGLKRAMSAMFVHGTTDKITFYDGLEGQYPAVPEAASFWARHNNFAGDSIITELPDLDKSDNTTVSLIQFSGGEDKTEVRLYRVNDGGHRWPGSGYTILQDLLGNNSLDFDSSSEILNFFKRNPHPNQPAGLAVDSDKSTILQFELKQNYPNPFNPVTAIGYQLSAVSNVELAVYNILGQKIAILVSERQAAGSYEVKWDAGHLAGGVYIYRIETEEFTQIRKMILIK